MPRNDLKRIRLIDAALEAALNQLGVRRYEQIAGWMRADVQRVGQALGIGGAINQENWIEQARVLAKGGETHYSARRARGETASAAPHADEGAAGPPPPVHRQPARPAPADVACRRERGGGGARAAGARKPAPVAGSRFADGGRARRLCRPNGPAAGHAAMLHWTRFRCALPFARQRRRATTCSVSAASLPTSSRV